MLVLAPNYLLVTLIRISEIRDVTPARGYSPRDTAAGRKAAWASAWRPGPTGKTARDMATWCVRRTRSWHGHRT
jgi:hypothetical protein